MKSFEKDVIDNIFLLIFVVLCSLGIFLGVLAADKNPDALEILRGESFPGEDFKEIFIWAILSKLFFIALSYLGGLSVFLTPLLLISVYTKAYSYGFTAGCIVALSGFGGFLKVLTGIFLQNFIFLSVLIIYSSFALGKSLLSYLNRRNYDYIKRKNKSFLKATVVILILSGLLSLLETAIQSKLTIYTL